MKHRELTQELRQDLGVVGETQAEVEILLRDGIRIHLARKVEIMRDDELLAIYGATRQYGSAGRGAEAEHGGA